MADREMTNGENQVYENTPTGGWAEPMFRQIAETAQKASPVRENPGDYYNDEGLLVCGKCHKQKQTVFRYMDKETIVPCVCDCEQAEIDREKGKAREEKRMQRVRELRSESLMEGKLREAHFDGYFINAENERAYTVAKRYTEHFDEMYDDGQGLIFYGSVGTGKTFTSACIANELIRKGRSVMMTSFVRILDSVSKSGGFDDRLLSTLKDVSLLILDDFGAERNTGFSSEKVYDVIDTRITEAKPMILTTNLIPKYVLDGPDTDSRRIFDRVLEVCYPVEMNGKSMRQAIGGIREKTAKTILEK